MFDDEIVTLLKRNSDVLEIQAEKLAQAARAVLSGIQEHNKHRILNNILIMKKALRRINEEFDELEFLLD